MNIVASANDTSHVAHEETWFRRKPKGGDRKPPLFTKAGYRREIEDLGVLNCTKRIQVARRPNAEGRSGNVYIALIRVAELPSGIYMR
jgi:hypothetical protein